MTRLPPLPLLAAVFTAGIVAAATLGGPWWATGAVAAALAGAVATWRPPTQRVALLAVAGVAVAAAGHARFAEADRAPPPALAGLTGTHSVEGVARADAFVSGIYARVDIDVDTIDSERVAAGGLRVTLAAPPEPLRAGDRVTIDAELEPPPQIEDFDYARFLRSRGIYAVAAFPERWTVVERDTGTAPVRALRGLRQWAVRNIERSLPEPEAALAAGMLLGQRRTMPAALADDLRATGTSHLVVVSGQNVALLLGTAVALLTAVMSRRRAALLTLALLPGYVLLVGADPPVVRAAIMAVGIAIAMASGRRTPGWVYLLYASALMLALDPRLARDIAFQLSMSATAGVMLLAPPLRDAVLTRAGWDGGGWRSALVEAGATAASAAIAVAPVQAAAFGWISLLTVPANVIVAPLYEATVVVAVFGAALGWIDPLASVIAAAGRFVPGAFITVVGLLAELPGGAIELRPPLAAGAAWYALVAAGVWALSRRPREALEPRARSGVATALALGIVAVGLWAAALAPGERLASVTVLDVGQGLAVLVRDGGASVLVDAGPPDGAVVRALPRADAGRSLDVVVITHANADHAGGLTPLLERFDIGRVLSGSPATAGERIDIGDRITLSDRTTIEVLAPPAATARRAHTSENDRSLVLLVTIGERRILLTADIEAGAEDWLVQSGLDVRADAIVVPHHGSRSSSSRALLDAVQPRVAVISLSAANPYGHPHPEVVARYEASGVLLLRTDEDGDVTLRSDGERLWVDSGR